MKDPLVRYWRFGLVAAAAHLVGFQLQEIFGWYPGNFLDYADGPVFQIINSIVLVFEPYPTRIIGGR